MVKSLSISSDGLREFEEAEFELLSCASLVAELLSVEVPSCDSLFEELLSGEQLSGGLPSSKRVFVVRLHFDEVDRAEGGTGDCQT